MGLILCSPSSKRYEMEPDFSHGVKTDDTKEFDRCALR